MVRKSSPQANRSAGGAHRGGTRVLAFGLSVVPPFGAFM